MTATTDGGSSPAVALRGVLWMAGASLFFAIGYLPVRELSPRYTPFDLIFYRSLLTVLFMLPWLWRSGPTALRTRRVGLHVFRVVITFIGMVCLFYGLVKMPLADATALLFTAPLFTIVLGAMVLGDHVGGRRWAVVAIGFAGGLIIIRPGFQAFSWPVLAIVVTAITYGASNAVTRALIRTEDTNAVVFYMSALLVPLALGPTLYDWKTPSWTEAPWLLLLGICTVLSQQCITRSLAAASAAIVMPAYYLQLPFIAVLAYAAYREVPAVWVWIGAAVICASTYYIIRLEARTQAAAKTAD